MAEDDVEIPLISFPSTLSDALLPRDGTMIDPGRLVELVWSELRLESLHHPFTLPTFNPCYVGGITEFVQTELKLQAEMMREEIHRKIERMCLQPKEATEEQPQAEKHLSFRWVDATVMDENRKLQVDLCDVTRQPTRQTRFTNYVVVLQREHPGFGGRMENLCLAFCTALRKADGALFVLGADSNRLVGLTGSSTVIYARPLRVSNFLKPHLQALAALKDVEPKLQRSILASQLLRGQIDPGKIRKVSELDRWVQSKLSSNEASSIDLEKFKKQQKRALALEDLTVGGGVVLVQGPPGTGKSHCICHGILPQVVSRGERVLVVCNSNVAVDALMLKCVRNVPSLRGKLLRVGFKENISDDIVNAGLFAEGSPQGSRGPQQRPNPNTNTEDMDVQTQIASKSIIFTTIHFASKEKGADQTGIGYWNFDTLVLDEAAQIEDSKLFIVLARCPSLRKAVLVGDPKQLQPYVPSSLRQQQYGKSSMERLMEATPKTAAAAPYVMLEEQFRMATALRKLVSHLFYNDRLKDSGDVATRGPQSLECNLRPLLVINVTGSKMAFNQLHQSYENYAEAAVVKTIHEYLLDPDSAIQQALPLEADLSGGDICILTPFNRHKDRLRMMICDMDEGAIDAYSGQTVGRQMVGSGGSPTKSQAMWGTDGTVEESLASVAENIDTVDKFQGSERKVVIISTCVDCKPLRAADRHFINVACSRAQHLLVVVGNFTGGLHTNKDWCYVWSKAKECGSYIEHEVEMTDEQDAMDIRSDKLLSKLGALVEQSRKKLKTGRRRLDF